MISAPELQTYSTQRAVLGEGIRYDAISDSLIWLDIPESQAWKISSAGLTTPLSLGPEAAFACVTNEEKILAGADGGLYLDGEYLCGREWLADNEVINDGAVHPSGQFLVFGSRDREEESAFGHMWLLGNQLTQLPWHFTVFNGPAFSADGTRVYFADSPERVIYTATVDIEKQKIGERRVFATVPEALGFPDGMICDDLDRLWSAHWDGGCVTCYAADGSVDIRYALPTSRLTSLAFKDTQVYVTSAREDCSDPIRGIDGSVFVFNSGVSGPSSPRLNAVVLRSTLSTQFD